ncbi:MAG: hypothetical protein QOE91_138, partial [Gaiellaceae bacterium]|nr:hypothetical protein [Gaiellaceae bacterium]
RPQVGGDLNAGADIPGGSSETFGHRRERFLVRFVVRGLEQRVDEVERLLERARRVVSDERGLERRLQFVCDERREVL